MKKFWRILIYILEFILLFIFVLLYLSAKWLQATYGDISFSTVVYQLLSPLKGTEQGLINSYAKDCILRGVGYAGVLFGIGVWNKEICENVLINCTIIIKRKEFKFRLKKNFYPMTLVCGLIVSVLIQAYNVGAVSFVRSLTGRSNLYENYYVSPMDVELVAEKKNNLILIYMESMETTFASIEDGGAKKINYIPELTKLANINVSFSDKDKLGGAIQCDGTDWTMAGLLSTSTGVNYKLPISRNSEKEYETLWPNLISIGEILEQLGYSNYYMCGSYAEFAGKRIFLQEHGNYNIWDQNTAIEDGVIPTGYKQNWGFEDEKLFEYAKDKLTILGKKGEPFNFTLLTADTHFPEGYICNQCSDIYQEQYANVISCSSKQMEKFVRWIQEQEWYADTTIVIIGDHISMNETFYSDIGDYERRIYNCFINVVPEVEMQYTRNRKYCSMDYFPTILSAVGVTIEGDRLGLGTDLFSGKETLIENLGFAHFNEELKKTSLYYYNFF